MKHILCATLALALTACASSMPFSGRPTVAKLSENFTTITGTVAAPPQLKNGGKRLFIYIAEEPNPVTPDKVVHDGDGSVATDITGQVVVALPNKVTAKDVSLCVAENTDNKQVLANIADYLNDPKAAGKVVYIYGKRVDSAWNEYVTGISCYINAIGFYVPESGSYIILTTDFGDGILDTMDWKSFVVMVFKTGIKFAK